MPRGLMARQLTLDQLIEVRILAGQRSATQQWPYRLTVRTEPSQGSNTGSIPVKATTSTQYRLPVVLRMEQLAVGLGAVSGSTSLSVVLCLPQ